MSTRVEILSRQQAYDRLMANLDDAEMGLYSFLQLLERSCHLSCVRDWGDDKWIALEEAEVYLGLLGGPEALLYTDAS